MNDEDDGNAYPMLQQPNYIVTGQTAVSEEISDSADRMIMYKYQTNNKKEEEKKASLQNESFITTNNSPLVSHR